MITMRETTNTKEKAVEFLRAKGLQPSIHRVSILIHLMKHKIHPTADDLYRALAPEIPTLSKATVYNTLKHLAAKGLVKPISIEGNELRYEYDRGDHVHFKCRKCGLLIDIADPGRFVNTEEIDGNIIEHQEINLVGICSQCANNGGTE